MPTTRLDTDYLVLGAGAMAMAFADVVLTEDPAAEVVLVDRRDAPGGHWNDSYPFVRLHQPAAFYGLHSAELGSGGGDLASGPEVVAYYRRAMDRLLATGRARFLPMCDHEGDGRVVPVLEPDHVVQVTARRRVVDATAMAAEVPARRPPGFAVGAGVAVVAPNGLPRTERAHGRYLVVGAGKTAIDAILFLLDAGCSPTRIRWIAPHDAWLWNRESVQPGRVMPTVTAMVRTIADAGDVDEVFLRLERQGIVLRVDTATMPTRWRCATVDRRELAALQRVEDVVRLGRVVRVDAEGIELEAGTVAADPDTLVVDCTADGLPSTTRRPLFDGGLITLQSVFMCQQTFSAALIAHLELLDLTDQQRNRACAPAVQPELVGDLPPALLTSVGNLLALQPHMGGWLRRSRLNPVGHGPRHRYLLGAARLVLLRRRALAAAERMASAR